MAVAEETQGEFPDGHFIQRGMDVGNDRYGLHVLSSCSQQKNAVSREIASGPASDRDRDDGNAHELLQLDRMAGMLQLAGIQRQPAAGQVDDLVEAANGEETVERCLAIFPPGTDSGSTRQTR